jgi:toxin ParE1/3/4
MQVPWTRPALADIEGLQDFIAAESPTAAVRHVDDLFDRTEKLLSANPHAGRKGRVSGTRELVLSGIPFVIAYRVTLRVEILAVVHSARDWPREMQVAGSNHVLYLPHLPWPVLV